MAGEVEGEGCWGVFGEAGVGEFPEAGEEAFCGALAEVDIALFIGDEESGGLVAGEGFFCDFFWVVGGVFGFIGFAECTDGALGAFGALWGAEGGAEFHHGVGVDARVLVAGELGGVLCDGRFGLGQGGGDGEEAGDDPFHVAIYHRGGLVVGGGHDDGSGIGADAGEGEQAAVGGGESSVKLLTDVLGALVQQMRAAVIAQALPVVEDGCEWGVGQRVDGGKGLHEALVVGDDSGDGGLLEHDFGQPDGVGVLGGIWDFAPGHGAVVLVIPMVEMMLEFADLGGRHGVGHCANVPAWMVINKLRLSRKLG